MSERMKVLGLNGLVLLCGIVLIAAVAAYAFGSNGDSQTAACSSGQWVHATVTKANGEKLSAENRRQLPKGYSATTASGDQKLTIRSDGSVEAEGGAVTVECITPTK